MSTSDVQPSAAMPIMGVPRVDLVPPIVEQGRRNTRTVRALTYGLGALVVLVGAATVGMAAVATTAEGQLTREQTRGQLLIQQQNQFTELTTVKQQLSDYDAAIPMALAAEADWSRLMTELDRVLPAGVALTTVNITVQGGASAAASSGVGLDSPGVIQVDFTAKAGTFDSPTPLLNALSKLTGHQSAKVDAVSATGEDGYVITGVVQLGAEALGGTARVNALDEDLMKDLHQQLEDVATGAVKPSTPPSAEAGTESTGE